MFAPDDGAARWPLPRLRRAQVSRAPPRRPVQRLRDERRARARPASPRLSLRQPCGRGGAPRDGHRGSPKGVPGERSQALRRPSRSSKALVSGGGDRELNFRACRAGNTYFVSFPAASNAGCPSAVRRPASSPTSLRGGSRAGFIPKSFASGGGRARSNAIASKKNADASSGFVAPLGASRRALPHLRPA